MEESTITIKYKNNITKGGWGQISCSQHITGQELRKLFAATCGLQSDGMRLLHKGKFLKDDQTLKSQNVTDKSSILLQQGKNEEEQEVIQQKVQKHETTERIIKAAEHVAQRTAKNSDDKNAYRFNIENQEGTKLKMSPEDNKNLVMAMTLHEKGVKMMEKGELGMAITFLLESDTAFQRVTDTVLLDKIDNYARLCLDITWCLLKSKNLSELDSHAWRLNKAHQILKNAYGEHNERLIQLRGGCCPDLVIYVRLFLLQAVVAYHRGDSRSSRSFLSLSSEKLSQMTIKEDDMIQLLQMGFSVREARVGLRATNKNPHEAIQWLFMRREKDQLRIEEEQRKKVEKRKQRNFGKTVNGKWVHLPLLEALVAQGFAEDLAAEALKQSDNDEEKTYDLLVNHVELLRIAMEKSKPPYVPAEEEIMQIAALGFTPSQAYGTLKLTQGDINCAVEKLLGGEGVEEPLPETVSPLMVEGETLAPPEKDRVMDDIVEDNEKKEAKEKEKQLLQEAEEKEKQLLQEAEDSLILDHASDELEAYDIDLTEETELLHQYEALILSNK